ncbi:TetR/AcrR family transcriptional regulator [Dyella humicola]|uniref:TetR/AcrR family transcriptional regulator n=1 Tax=Dyella humicola TaxID=2992126 RepID=UPI0022596D0B|nr:TetR/AcrR family transcriptional regulator [Dyella humicola]
MSTNRRRPTLKPRKTPSQARSGDTVAAMLEAAARILERHGFAGYTTNAVAERAGVSIGTLYQYFPNKDALTAALIDRETAPLVDALQQARQATHFAEGIDALVGAAVSHQMRRPELARLLDFEERRLPLGARDTYIFNHLSGAIVELFGRRGAPSVDGAILVAADIIAIVKGLVDAAGERGERDAEHLRLRVGKAVRGYLRG